MIGHGNNAARSVRTKPRNCNCGSKLRHARGVYFCDNCGKYYETRKKRQMKTGPAYGNAPRNWA